MHLHSQMGTYRYRLITHGAPQLKDILPTYNRSLLTISSAGRPSTARLRHRLAREGLWGLTGAGTGPNVRVSIRLRGRIV